MQVQLIVKDHKRSGQVIPINTPSFTIGQEKDCNLRSGSSQTSPKHCLIRINEGVITIKDLHSETGTFVNGTKIASTAILHEGDKIEVGRHTFILSTQDRTEIAETADSPEPEDTEDDTGILFDVRLEGQRLTVTKKRLFQLAKQGMLLPDDVVTIDGTKVFADTIQDIVFGDKQPAKPAPHAAPEPAGYTIQDAPVAKDISPTDSVWNRFVDAAAADSDERNELPDPDEPDPDEKESDPFTAPAKKPVLDGNQRIAILRQMYMQASVPDDRLNHRDSSPADSAWNRFVDAAAAASNKKNELPDPDEEESDPFNIKDEPVVQVALPSKTSKSVISEIGEAIAPSLSQVSQVVTTEQKEMLHRYYKPAGYTLGVLCLLGILGFLVSGNNSPPGIFYVEGTVHLDGVPVAGVSVTLNPRDETGDTADGMTDSKGRFAVTTGTAPIGSGAKEGEYDITFYKTEQDTQGLTSAEFTRKYGNQKPKTKYVIPQKYGDVNKSGLTPIKVVSDGSNKFKFELTSPPTPKKAEIAEIPPPVPSEPDLLPANDLFTAARRGTVQEVEDCLDNGADINAHDPFGRTPLHIAVQYNSDEAVALYLISKGADVNAKDRYDSTPLCLAVRSFRSSVEVVNALISKGVDVNVKDRNERSVLHMAASAPPTLFSRDNQVEILKVLLSKGAFVNPRDRIGRTPLDVANTEAKRAVLRAAGGIARPVSPRPGPPPASFASNNQSAPSSDTSVPENSFIPSSVPPPVSAIEEVPNISVAQPPDVQYNVGLSFFHGSQDIPPNKAEALKWFHAAAKQGHADAQFQVGKHYYYGWEVLSNESEGINWIQKAADQEHKKAIDFLQEVERKKEIFETSP